MCGAVWDVLVHSWSPVSWARCESGYSWPLEAGVRIVGGPSEVLRADLGAQTLLFTGSVTCVSLDSADEHNPQYACGEHSCTAAAGQEEDQGAVFGQKVPGVLFLMGTKILTTSVTPLTLGALKVECSWVQEHLEPGCMHACMHICFSPKDQAHCPMHTR